MKQRTSDDPYFLQELEHAKELEAMGYKFVYVACTLTNECKIGWTRHLARRLKNLRDSEREPIRLICFWSQIFPQVLERRLHKHFRKKGRELGGEWFSLSNNDLEYLCEHSNYVMHLDVDLISERYL